LEKTLEEKEIKERRLNLNMMAWYSREVTR